MKIRIILVVCLLLLAFSTLVTAQTRRRPQFSDSASLRASFLAAFGNDFELVKDEITSRTNQQGGGMFWLAYVRPLGPGHFALQYSFKRDDRHYSHEEREIQVSVGPKGCRRGPPSSGVYSRFCLGDTIIVPVLVSGASGFEFKLTKQTPAADEDWRTFNEKYPENRDHELDKTPVTNPSESLRYIGRSSYKALHRALGYTLRLQADFEAVKPGKFNLLVSTSAAGSAGNKNPVGVPIIVVDHGTPVTLIAGREEVRGFTMGHDGREYVSSTSGNSYMTNLIVLQPGDRISVPYLSVRRGGDFERRMNSGRVHLTDPAEGTKPVISVHAFALETNYDFSGWLADYLPD